MLQYKIKMSRLAEEDLDDPVLAELGVHKTYYKEYKIFFVIDHDTNTVYVIRILHMLVDSRAWLYRTFDISM